MTMPDSHEKRSCVRVPFMGRVSFRVIEEDECELLCQNRGLHRSAGYSALISELFEEPSIAEGHSTDVNLVRFLLHLEDKLDRILTFLGDKPEKGMELGCGVDISSAGLKFSTPCPLEIDQYLEIRLKVSRYPVVRLDILGKVVRVTPFQEHGSTIYEVAVALMEGDDHVAESIMAYAFRVQRGALRAMKETSEGDARKTASKGDGLD